MSPNYYGGQNYGGKYNNGNQYQNRTRSFLPDNYLKNGFRDKNGKLYVSLVSSDAQSIAEQLDRGGDRNKPTQIRKFYEYLVNLDHLVKQKHLEVKDVDPELEKMVYISQYALNRNKVTKVFCDFIVECVDHIETREDIAAFKEHFQAVIAFRKKQK